MLVDKVGQINNMRLTNGVARGSAEMSQLQNCSVKISKEHCRYFTQKRNGGCQLRRIKVIVIMQKKIGGGGGGWMCMKN